MIGVGGKCVHKPSKSPSDSETRPCLFGSVVVDLANSDLLCMGKKLEPGQDSVITHLYGRAVVSQLLDIKRPVNRNGHGGPNKSHQVASKHLVSRFYTNDTFYMKTTEKNEAL